jgi:hypothetical protein
LFISRFVLLSLHTACHMPRDAQREMPTHTHCICKHLDTLVAHIINDYTIENLLSYRSHNAHGLHSLRKTHV